MNKKEALKFMDEYVDEAGDVATDAESTNLYVQAIAVGIKYLVQKTVEEGS